MRQKYLKMSIPARTVEVMINSLSDNTYRQYDTCIRPWLEFCRQNDYDYSDTNVIVILDFLTKVFDKGAKYGTINSYKSALSLLFPNLLDDYRIKKFMKGVFRSRPTQPKYNMTWDTDTVLSYLSEQWPHENLDLETLSKKTLTLLALVTAHRVQTLSQIKISNINVNNPNLITIKIPDLIKTSRPNLSQPFLKLPFFSENPSICPATCLKDYINKTNSIRETNNDYLFISYKRPYKKLSSQRLSHWIKETLQKSGIDITIFSAHSTRHAATSRANRAGVNIDVIRSTAGWSQSSATFAKFYNREIINDNFARSILESV
nr:uncharacterized protein LOC117984575 [Maniola hyperantus]